MKDISAKVVLSFLIGLIIGGAAIWFIFCGCCKKHCEYQCHMTKQQGNHPPPTTIDTTTAKTYFGNYLISPVSIDQFKAFAVNRTQYDAMTLILNNDNTVKGFRIYMGATDNAGTQRISMVVGFGSPDHYQSIYAADMEESGPCPFICDETSPIVPQGK